MKKSLALFVLCIACVAWFFFNWSALVSLHLRWIKMDESYSVGYPFVLMSFWWLFNRRGALSREAVRPAISGLFALAIVLLLSTFGRLVQFQVLQQIAAPLSLWLIVTALFGWRLGWRCLPCFLVLLFAIPFLDVGDVLRAMTVWFTQHILSFMAIPAFVSGYNIALPAGVIAVAGGCSGFNLLLAAIFMGLAYGESAEQSLARRMLITALAIVIGIFDNWVRVLTLVLVAHYSDMKSDLVYHHGSFGWWVFALSLVPFFILARKIERAPVAPVVSGQLLSASVPIARRQAISMVVMAAVISALCISLLQAGEKMAESRGLAVNGFTLRKATPIGIGWMPQYSGQDVTQFWQMAGLDTSYEVTALTYLSESKDKKLIYYANRLADENSLRATGRVMVESGVTVNTAVIDDGGLRMVWWFWWVDGSISNRALLTKILQMKALLLGDRSSALIAVSTRCKLADCGDQLEVPPAVSDLVRELRSIKFGKP